MKRKADLHIHTYYSDGVFSPEKIVDTAVDVGLEAIAITDHDNILAYDVAQKYIDEKVCKIKLKLFAVLRLILCIKTMKFTFWGTSWIRKTKIFLI